MSKRFYFDHASTAFPKAPGVGEAMADYLIHNGRSAGRGIYATAFQAEEAVLELRERLCCRFGAPSPRNVILTPGATYAINQVLFGLLRPGQRVLSSAVEHNAVARPLHLLAQQGVDTVVLPCDGDGALAPGWESMITREVRLVVLAHASNVAGVIQPVAQIGRRCRDEGVFFCVDAAQSAGSLPIHMEEMCIDALAIPGHKGLLGPQGIGALLLGDALAAELRPLVLGGTGSHSDRLDMPDHLPDRLESGTLNLPGVYGLLAALRWRDEQDEDALRAREARLTRHLLGRLRELEEDGLRVLGPLGYGPRATLAAVDLPALDNADAAFRLERDFGIEVRCGLHCAPLAHRVLGTYPQGAVRFSVGPFTRFEDIDYLQGALCEVMGV